MDSTRKAARPGGLQPLKDVVAELTRRYPELQTADGLPEPEPQQEAIRAEGGQA